MRERLTFASEMSASGRVESSGLDRRVYGQLFLVVLLFISLFSFPVEAKKRKSSGIGASQAAVVKSDSVIVYSKPDFDAPTISYLSGGQEVRLSKKQYGQVQKFFKLRLPNGKIGYVSTIDVTSPSGDNLDKSLDKKTAKASDKADKSNKADKKEPPSESRNRARYRREIEKEMSFNRWVGLLAGSLAFKEKIKGTKGEDDLVIYGLKVTGPDILLEGPIMDLNVMLHIGAPKYYEDLSRIKATGFIFMTDALLLFPVTAGRNSSVYLGAGPLFKFTNFKYITLAGTPKNIQKVSLGASGSIGLGVRLGAIALRAEAKYIAESSTQLVYQLSLQTFY